MSFFKGNGFSFELNLRTYVMGILNVTPDSFFDGGRWNDPEKAVLHALEMQRDGADIIDIGAQSTRPGSVSLSEKDEKERIKPYIDALCGKIEVPVSVDTFYPSVADYCLERGAAIINDVSGKINPDMAQVIKRHGAGWIVMHTGGKSACEKADYSKCGGVLNNVLDFFAEAESKAGEYGIKKENLCFDPGIGFGKAYEDNLEIIRNIKSLKTPDRAVLTALSCKRVIGKASGAEGEDRIFGTIAADTVAIAGGADFIRVHHVKQAVYAAKTADALLRRQYG